MNPDSSAPRNAKRRQTKIRRSANHHFFEGAYVPVHIAPNRAEIQNWIADDLPGAMKGDVSAAIGVVQRDIFLAQYIFIGEEIFAFGIASKRDDGRVFA